MMRELQAMNEADCLGSDFWERVDCEEMYKLGLFLTTLQRAFLSLSTI